MINVRESTKHTFDPLFFLLVQEKVSFSGNLLLFSLLSVGKAFERNENNLDFSCFSSADEEGEAVAEKDIE